MKQRFSWKDESAGGAPLQLECLDTGGAGEETLLFVSGFAAGADSWRVLLAALPAAWRALAVELDCGSGRAPAEQGRTLSAFIRAHGLRDFTLVAHSLGTPAAVEALGDPATAERCRRLIIIDGAGLSRELPEFAARLNEDGDRNPLRRQVGTDLKSYLLLSGLFCDAGRIDDAAVRYLSEFLRRRPDAARRFAAAALNLQQSDADGFARQLAALRIPVLVIWGAADPMLPLATAWEFSRRLGDCPVETLPYCGHLPQLEFPVLTAELIANFVRTEFPTLDHPEAVAPAGRRRIRLRRLVDHWTLSAALFILFLKGLQLLRRLGVKAEENGWRKATGIFMRNEYSKFILATFRLRFYTGKPPQSYGQARQALAARLTAFLHRQPSFHWSAEPGFFSLGRRKTFFCDIVEAHYTPDGKLARLVPYFDDQRGNFDILSARQIDDALQEIIRNFNFLLRASGRHRVILMAERMRRWVKRYPGLKYAGRTALTLLVDRLMTATYLHCELLPAAPAEAQRLRLRTPNLKRYRHPGWGLLNIFCRFTADFSEADLWVQFHHVPVDGAPMQELLGKLKREWGEAGPLLYPANAENLRPEIIHCGDRLFRARFYADFEPMLKLRAFLNERYCGEAGGSVTIAGMLLWGLSRHAFFHERKMLLPVDSSILGDPTRERELSLAFIRPGKFDTPGDPLKGFLAFQRAFNRMISDIRLGRSESEEFLELCSMAHPVFYHLADWLVPHALREIVGTVGISILRDAEMFISPLSDFQTAGFMAIGSMAVPAEDGRRIGAVSVCGSRTQVRDYYEAVVRMTRFYPDFLQLEDYRPE